MPSELLKCFVCHCWLAQQCRVLCLLFTILLVGAVRAQDAEDVDLEEQAIAAAVERVAPSVVRIETLGGREKVENLLVSEAPTTGLVISDDGYIVSSSFNFVHDPSSILVQTPSGKRQAAKIIARDRARMLVLLKISTDEKLVVPEFVPRGEMQVGQWAIAVGRTLEGTKPNLSVGVLSALQRVWGRAIQTDAKISPSNYGGPLIDIEGRVLGVLTPLSTMGEGDIAGLEWYDSGIGFAAPLADWLPRLEGLKAGKDLQAGLLGISLKPGDIYALPAEIAVAQLNAPGYKAGFRQGDVITEIDGQKIERQVQLRHALGRHYAGDTVKVIAKRGDVPIEASVDLVDKLEPYSYPMIGILPMRATTGDGIVIRALLPKSPAEIAELKPGDRIVTADEKPITTIASLQEIVAAFDPQKKLAIKFQRAGETKTADIDFKPLSLEVPAMLPPAVAGELPAKPEKLETGLLDLKLPEEKQDCFAYIPENYDPAIPHALVVWLAPPGQFDKAEIEKRWKQVAEQYHLIVISPRPAEAGRWQSGEAAVVRKFIDNAITRFSVDKNRTVLVGRQASGMMAWFTTLQNRNLIRGVVVVDAPLPPRAPIENDPVNRLFVYSFATKSQTAPSVEASHKRMTAGKVPLTTRALAEDRDLNAAELEDVARWIDSLDRI